MNERTRELAEVNERLRCEVEERKRAEAHQALLLAELKHRVRNTLAIVKSIARQTARYSHSLDEFNESFGRRIQALADTHSLLLEGNWVSPALDELVKRHLRPYAGDNKALTIRGPRIVVSPKSALTLSLVLHELAANAAKHGALSLPHGKVEVSWEIESGADPRMLHVVWRESDGPAVAPPRRRGFGSELIDFSLAHEFKGRVRTEYARQGLVCRLDLPLPDGRDQL